jgi:hypothetical protein
MNSNRPLGKEEKLRYLKVGRSTFQNICDEWRLSQAEIGMLMPLDRFVTDLEKLQFYAVIFGVYKRLRVVFPKKAQANAWIKKSNINYDGKSALKYISKNGLSGALEVKSHLPLIDER